jgi:CMP-N-acetylneuraminic acid synthetase
MTRSVAVMLNARLRSSRSKDKMVRPFAGSSLVEIALRKLAHVDADARYFCVAEEPLLALFERIRPQGVELLRRSPEAVSGDAPQAIINAHYARATTTHIAFMNACHPFMLPSTLSRAIELLKSDHRIDAMTSTVTRRDWLYGEDGAPLLRVDLSIGDTKRSPRVHRVAHAFHIFPRQRFVSGDPIFRDVPGDPYLFSIPEEEAVDIDTELELRMAQAYAERAVDPAKHPWFQA